MSIFTSEISGDSCILNLPFDEGSGTIAHDRSDYNNNGTIYGATWTSRVTGSALYFGGNAYVEVPDSPSLDITGEITIMAWIQPSVSPSLMESHAGIVVKGAEDYELSFSSGNLNLYFRIIDSAGGIHTALWNANNIVANNVYHIVGVWNGLNHKLIVNNSVVDEITWTGSIRVTATPLLIGELAKGNFNGIIDSVRIYNRALSREEIQAHFRGARLLPLRGD